MFGVEPEVVPFTQEGLREYIKHLRTNVDALANEVRTLSRKVQELEQRPPSAAVSYYHEKNRTPPINKVVKQCSIWSPCSPLLLPDRMWTEPEKQGPPLDRARSSSNQYF